MDMLKRLYKIYSPSGYEDRMSDFIQGYLDSLGIKHKTWGKMIYWINPGTPLICAHMDHIADFPQSRIKEKNGILYGTGNLGADDKNGIWLALKLIEQYRENISFIFSVEEESGGALDLGLLDHIEPLLDKVLYGILFDRLGAGDIICDHNFYGTRAFEKQLYLIGKRYGYKPARGIWSDADALSHYISCANLSCGYHNAHTSKEYTVISELENALAYGMAIIKQLKKKFKPVTFATRGHKSRSYIEPWADFVTPSKKKKSKKGKKKKANKGTMPAWAMPAWAKGTMPAWAEYNGYDADRELDWDDPAVINCFCPNCLRYFESDIIGPEMYCPSCNCQLIIDEDSRGAI